MCLDGCQSRRLTFLGGGCMLDERPALQPHRWQPVLHRRPPGRGALLFSYASPDTTINALPLSALLACSYATALLPSTELAYLLIAHALTSSRCYATDEIQDRKPTTRINWPFHRSLYLANWTTDLVKSQWFVAHSAFKDVHYRTEWL